MNALLEEQGKLQEYIDAHNLWELDRKVEIAMDALRLPPADADVTTLSGGEKRRVALCKVLLEEPDMLLLDEPTNHLDAESVAWLERFLADFPGNGRRHHARPLLPRQRREVDPRARPRQGNSVGGELHELARTEAEPARARGEDGERAPAHARARARVGAHGAARAAGQEQGAHPGVRAAPERGAAGQGRDERDRDSAAGASRQRRRDRRRSCGRRSATACCSRT